MSIPVSTIAIIHEDRLRHNVRCLKARLGRVSLMGVVKANAYGHGAEHVARVLESEGVPRLAVATLAEAVALRHAGLSAPILVFAPPTPEQIPFHAAFNLEAVVDSPRTLDTLVRANVKDLSVHVKVDTGMGRYGVPAGEATDLIRRTERSVGLHLAGLWTHLADADTPQSPQTAEQLRRFHSLLHALGGAPCPLHVANSGAIYTSPDAIDPDVMSCARAGIALYGLLDVPEARQELLPVMELQSRVVAVRNVSKGSTISYAATWTAPEDTVVATIGAGYADGVSRCLSGIGRVSIGDRTYPIRGRICMDAFMVELGPGNPADVCRHDLVRILGDHPSAFDVAHACSTITYEVTCRIAQRVPRIAYNPVTMRD